MFLKCVTDVAADFGAVSTALRSEPRDWLTGIAVAVGEEGDELVVDAGLEVVGRRLSRRAVLDVGEALATERVTMLPLRLHAQDHGRLFPTLEGTLDAAWLGPGRTYLALSLTYEPPLGLLGRVVDQALLHRVAEAVSQRLLLALAGELAAKAGLRF
jgi:hypothetical protein